MSLYTNVVAAYLCRSLSIKHTPEIHQKNQSGLFQSVSGVQVLQQLKGLIKAEAARELQLRLAAIQLRMYEQMYIYKSIRCKKPAYSKHKPY